MKLENMKNSIPETPEFIHEMIQNEVKKQLQDVKVVNIQNRRVKKWTVMKASAAIAVFLLAASTVVYAGVRLYHIFIEKQGNYAIEIGIRTDDGKGEEHLPEEIHDIDITAGYIPEGMEWTDEFHLQYPEHGRTGGISFSSVLLDDDDTEKVVQDQNVVESEERTFGNRKGIYIRYNDLMEDGSFNQRIYLLCPDIYRVITVYMGDDVSKEEGIRFVENLMITENEKMVETSGLYTWSELVSPEVKSEETVISVEDDRLPVHQIGETFKLHVTGEDVDGNIMEDNRVSVCVDSVQAADDLRLLDQNHVPEKWLAAVGSDGKLVNNTLSYIKAGDGVNSVDEIIKTESVRQKLIYVAVTYTNETDRQINHLHYLGTLMLINHEDGKYRICSSADLTGADCGRVVWDGTAYAGEMAYYSIAEDYGNGGNYISSIQPGESIQVAMAWIVNENELPYMYLNLNSEGAALEFTDSVLESGVVDICQ